MKTYINRRPPWGWPQSEYRLYVVLNEEETGRLEREKLVMPRVIREYTNKVLIRHRWAACVPFSNEPGQLLKVISREE